MMEIQRYKIRSFLVLALVATLSFFMAAPTVHAQQASQSDCEDNADNRCWDAAQPPGSQCIFFGSSNIWSPPVGINDDVCTGQTVSQTSPCGTTRNLVGGTTKQFNSPPTSDYCSGAQFRQNANCFESDGTIDQQDATGTDPITSWNPPESTICRGIVYTGQPANCLEGLSDLSNDALIGEKDSANWAPSTDFYCDGESFTQLGDCVHEGTPAYELITSASDPHERDATGTAGDVWQPDPSVECQNKTLEQETACFLSNNEKKKRNVQGTKTVSDVFSPDHEEYCTNAIVRQEGRCGDTRSVAGGLATTYDPPAASICSFDTVNQFATCKSSNSSFGVDDGAYASNPSNPISGTKTTGECCEETAWNPPDSDLANYCTSEAVPQMGTTCGLPKTPVAYGTKTTDECCVGGWTPAAHTVCAEDADGNPNMFEQTNPCYPGQVQNVQGTKKSGSCVAAGDCIPGIPCVTERALYPVEPPAFDGKIDSNESGENAHKTSSDTCDADFMNQIYARAYLEAEREQRILQTSIRKPDSVLEYSCFKNFVNTLGYWSPSTFSESKKWSKTACQDDSSSLKNFGVPCDSNPADPTLYEVEIGGAIDDIPLDDLPTVLEVYMAQGLAEDETRMGFNLEGLVMRTLNTYLNDNENFSHPYLGGSGDPTNSGLVNNQVNGDIELKPSIWDPTDPLDIDCVTMNNVWWIAQCGNFGTDDLVQTFEEFIGIDTRQFPKRCEIDSEKIQAKTGYLSVSRNRFAPKNPSPYTRKYPTAFVDSAQYVSKTGNKTFYDFMSTEECETPIPTGLKVVKTDYQTVDWWGTVELVETVKDEYICVNPNCYYDIDTEKCEIEPPSL